MIVDITPFLANSFQELIFEKISQTSIENFDEKFIKMITEFTVKAIDKEKPEIYATNILYELCLDTSKIKMQELAIDCFIDVLKCIKSSGKIWAYIENCIKNIKNNNSVSQSMLLILKITQQVVNPSYNLAQKDEVYRKIDSFAEGIVKLLINSIQKFQSPENKSVFSLTKNIKTRMKF